MVIRSAALLIVSQLGSENNGWYFVVSRENTFYSVSDTISAQYLDFVTSIFTFDFGYNCNIFGDGHLRKDAYIEVVFANKND